MSGPSGVGKGTLINKMFKEYPNNFGFSVSHTTRKPRPGEKNGIDYYFVDENEMKERINNGEFLEYACVHGKYYGTSVKAYEDVSNAGKICIFDIDVQGAKNLKSNKNFNQPPHTVFVLPPSNKELERRLRGRGTENEETIQRRLSNAFGEIEYAKQPGSYEYLLVNDDLDKSFNILMKKLIEWYPQLKS